MSTIKTTTQLGDALRAARKQLGLTQPRLALAAGVGVRFIVDLEAGKATLRLLDYVIFNALIGNHDEGRYNAGFFRLLARRADEDSTGRTARQHQQSQRPN